jgi:hypothetical protein
MQRLGLRRRGANQGEGDEAGAHFGDHDPKRAEREA